VMESTIGRP